MPFSLPKIAADGCQVEGVMQMALHHTTQHQWRISWLAHICTQLTLTAHFLSTACHHCPPHIHASNKP